MLSYDRQTAWFSRLVRHPARKWSGSILTTLEPARGLRLREHKHNLITSFTFHRPAHSEGDPQQHVASICTEAVHHQKVPPAVFHLSLTTKAPGHTLVRVTEPFVSPRTPVQTSFDWSFARLIAPVVQLSPSFASINTG